MVLDSDIIIDLMRGLPAARSWLTGLGRVKLMLPGYVVMELVEGCRNKKELETLQKELRAYEIIWPQPSGCDAALKMFVRYHLSHSLGLLDSLIAACALSVGLPLHTFNQKHYEAVPNLRTIQPYVR